MNSAGSSCFRSFLCQRVSISRAATWSMALAVCWTLPFLQYGWLLSHRTFPLGDGGLWYVVAKSLLQNGFALPLSVEFNGTDMALSYPPLGAYLLASVNAGTAVDLLALLIWLPFVLNILSAILFHLFAKRYFQSDPAAICSSLLFPYILQLGCPMFFTGGSLPRSLGLVFMLWALYVACGERVRHCKTSSLLLGVIIGGAILSHPTAGLWSAAGVTFLSAYEHRFGRTSLLLAGVSSAIVIAPWLAYVLPVNGVTPFLSALAASGGEMWGWRRLGTPEAWLIPGGFLGALGIVGMLLLLRRGLYTAPCLLLVGLVLDHRGLFVLHGVVIAVLAIGTAVAVIYESLSSLNSDQTHLLQRYLPHAVFALLLVGGYVVELVDFRARFAELSDDPMASSQAPYAVISRSLPSNRPVLYLRGRALVERAEWLSVFSNATFFPFSQAAEWDGTYARHATAFNNLARCCQSGSIACVASVVAEESLKDAVVLVDQHTCARLIDSFPLSVQKEALPGAVLIREPSAVFRDSAPLPAVQKAREGVRVDNQQSPGVG